MKRIVSGIQPTSGLTLGNYLGSIKQFLQMQDNYEMFIFVADLHAITTGLISPKELKQNTLDLVRSYLAFGLDPNKVNLFIQSTIKEHTELGYLLMCQTTIGELSRMTQFKDKSTKFQKEANGTQKLPTGLLIYPTLMAADILLYSPDYVPVGIDQKQHIELTRNIAERINNKFKTNLFKVPNIILNKEGAKIMDLCDHKVKMSKSTINKKGVIFLNDPIDISCKKILSAKTDSLNKVNYDVETQPELANLINIYSCLSNMEINDICNKYINLGYKEFKQDLADLLHTFLLDYQNKLKIYDDNYIYKVIDKSYEKVKKIAKAKLNETLEKLGFVNYEKC